MVTSEIGCLSYHIRNVSKMGTNLSFKVSNAKIVLWDICPVIENFYVISGTGFQYAFVYISDLIDLIMTEFTISQDRTVVLACAKHRCDWISFLWSTAIIIFIEFRLSIKISSVERELGGNSFTCQPCHSLIVAPAAGSCPIMNDRWCNTIQFRYLAIIFLQTELTKDTHSSPVRPSYGVCFVSSQYDQLSIIVLSWMCCMHDRAFLDRDISRLN